MEEHSRKSLERARTEEFKRFLKLQITHRVNSTNCLTAGKRFLISKLKLFFCSGATELSPRLWLQYKLRVKPVKSKIYGDQTKNRENVRSHEDSKTKWLSMEIMHRGKQSL